MSWTTLHPDIQQLAEQHLTPRQLQVLKLHLAGLGTRRTSDMLNITRSTVRTHLDEAHHRLRQQDIHTDSNGNYYQHTPSFHTLIVKETHT